MNEISINGPRLADKVGELKKLKMECENHKFWNKEEQMYGSGEVIDILNSIDKEQVLLMESFLSLLTNSIDFFDNVLSSIYDADVKSASKFN